MSFEHKQPPTTEEVLRRHEDAALQRKINVIQKVMLCTPAYAANFLLRLEAEGWTIKK